MSSLVINASNYHQPYLMGSINSRMYPRWVYEMAGFTTRRHILRRDEYYFNNVKYNLTEANRLMERMGWEIRESRLYGQNGLIIHTTDIYHNGRLISHWPGNCRGLPASHQFRGCRNKHYMHK